MQVIRENHAKTTAIEKGVESTVKYTNNMGKKRRENIKKTNK